MMENTVVNSLWIGDKLSVNELLTLKSFVAHGHDFVLWSYSDLSANLPVGVELKDANQIIPFSSAFRYPSKGFLDWGKGSWGGFSDIFRYQLLHEYGGWWVDMDVTCLRQFDFDSPYFFRNHWLLSIVGNVMKCPKQSLLMEACYIRANKEVTRENTDWHLPVRILNEEIVRLGLQGYRRTGLFNLDMKHTIDPYLKADYPVPADWYGIHWVNSGGIRYKKSSTYHILLKKYGLA
jgi:hypothetical protein